MTKPLIVVILAVLALAIAGCAADPPTQTSDPAFATPSDSASSYDPLTMPVHFLF